MPVATTGARAEKGKKAAYVLVPVEVARGGEISDGAFRTYCVLKRYCFGRRSYCWPSMKTLAAERGCSDETIRRHVGEIAGARLVRIERKGRHNVYWFDGEGKEPVPGSLRRRAESHRSTDDVFLEVTSGNDSVSATSPQPGHPRGLEDREYAHRTHAGTGDSCGGRVHTDEGQGFSKQGKETTVVVAHERSEETTAKLIANGVAQGAARRLVEIQGEETCRYALELLEWEQARGLRVRNTGGWLYSAVTQGFVRVEERKAAVIDAVAPTEVAAVEEEHVARIKERRREALKRRGIPDEADELWARVRARMRERGQGSRLLAAAFLRPVGEGKWCVEGAASGIAERLKELLPAISEAVREEAGEAKAVVEVAG